MPAPKKPVGKKIEREDQRAWWCPICDHSNAQLEQSCGGCGAVRNGASVKAS